MRKYIVAMAAILLSGSAISQSQPQGWDAIVAAINDANPFNPQTLKDKQFTITVPDARQEDTLVMNPADAFQVSRTAAGSFVVKIVNPDALVQLGAIKRFKPIGWTLTQSGVNPFGASIEGRAFCSYELSFRQKGGNDFNLASLEPEYDIAFEESGAGQLSTRARTSSGLSVQRVPGDQAKIDVRMVLKSKSGPERYMSNWVSVPSCAGPSVPNTSTPIPTVTAASCMKRKTVELSTCTDECGVSTMTLKERFENVCTAHQVRCENMQWSSSGGAGAQGKSGDYWVQLPGGQYTDLQVSLPIPKPPFSVSPPNMSASCKFI